MAGYRHSSLSTVLMRILGIQKVKSDYLIKEQVFSHWNDGLLKLHWYIDFYSQVDFQQD